MPPPPKKERRDRSERSDKDRPDGEGERASVEGRPEVERQERVRPEGDTPEKEKSDKEQPIKDKPDTEKDISPAITKKPGSKKTRYRSDSCASDFCLCFLMSSQVCIFLFSRPKSDNHQSPPSDKHSIQSGKSATKTNKNSHISRCVSASHTACLFSSMTTHSLSSPKNETHATQG